MNNCDLRGRMFGGCRFEARYDTRPPEIESIEGLRGGPAAVEAFLRGLTAKTYVHDVCVRCGATVKREDRP